MAATLQETTHPRAPFTVLYTDPTQRESTGRAKRIQKHFSNKTDAEAYLREINKQLQVVGSSGMKIYDHELKNDALSARTLLDDHGFKNLSLLELVRAHIKEAPSIKSLNKPALEALEEFLNKKRYEENCSEDTIKNLSWRMKRWFKQCGIKTVAQITVETARALQSRRAADGKGIASARHRKNDMGAANVFCGYLINHELLDANPFDRVEWPKVPKKRPIAWDPEEAELMLRAAEKYRGGYLVPTLVARIFCGLRPSEVKESKVILDSSAPTIRAEGGKLKGRANRSVPIQANALDWFIQYPPAPDGTLPFLSVFAYQTLRDEAMKLNPNIRMRWVPDIARHTFISYRMVTVKNDHTVATESGNSAKEIHQSYRDLKSEEQAKRFWSIAPNRKAALKTKLKKAGAEATV